MKMIVETKMYLCLPSRMVHVDIQMITFWTVCIWTSKLIQI